MEFSVADARISVNAPSRDGLLANVEQRLIEKKGFAIATLNLDHLVKLQDQTFSRAYRAHDFVTADGNPIVWMSKLANRPVELITGSDLIYPLAEVALRTKTKIGFFGSSPDSLARAAAQMEKDFPGIEIVARIAPRMGFDPAGASAEEALRELHEAGAEMIFIALGAPKQEVFAALGRKLMPQMSFVSIGAGLDFIAGTQNRAPELVQALALEWMWRMLTNPRRMAKRYALCFKVLPQHLVQTLEQRFAAVDKLKLRVEPATHR